MAYRYQDFVAHPDEIHHLDQLDQLVKYHTFQNLLAEAATRVEPLHCQWRNLQRETHFLQALLHWAAVQPFLFQRNIWSHETTAQHYESVEGAVRILGAGAETEVQVRSAIKRIFRSHTWQDVPEKIPENWLNRSRQKSGVAFWERLARNVWVKMAEMAGAGVDGGRVFNKLEEYFRNAESQQGHRKHWLTVQVLTAVHRELQQENASSVLYRQQPDAQLLPSEFNPEVNTPPESQVDTSSQSQVVASSQHPLHASSQSQEEITYQTEVEWESDNDMQIASKHMSESGSNSGSRRESIGGMPSQSRISISSSGRESIEDAPSQPRSIASSPHQSYTPSESQIATTSQSIGAWENNNDVQDINESFLDFGSGGISLNNLHRAESGTPDVDRAVELSDFDPSISTSQTPLVNNLARQDEIVVPDNNSVIHLIATHDLITGNSRREHGHTAVSERFTPSIHTAGHCFPNSTWRFAASRSTMSALRYIPTILKYLCPTRTMLDKGVRGFHGVLRIVKPGRIRHRCGHRYHWHKAVALFVLFMLIYPVNKHRESPLLRTEPSQRSDLPLPSLSDRQNLTASMEAFMIRVAALQLQKDAIRPAILEAGRAMLVAINSRH